MLNDPEDTSLNALETALLLGRERAPRLIANPLQDGAPFVVLRNADGSERIEYIPPSMKVVPQRTIRRARAVDIDGLLTYWKAHATGESNIYFNGKDTIHCIFDDHVKGVPEFCGHTLTYTMLPSPELERWTQKNTVHFATTEAFAEFIENNVADFVDPTGARMLEIALNFHATSKASYSKAVRLQNGSIQLQYTQENNAGAGTIAVPDGFRIVIRIFDYAIDKYAIDARLRWRLKGSALEIWYELIDLEKILREASDRLIMDIEAKTERKILRVMV